MTTLIDSIEENETGFEKIDETTFRRVIEKKEPIDLRVLQSQIDRCDAKIAELNARKVELERIKSACLKIR